jgi:hypothetical protein
LAHEEVAMHDLDRTQLEAESPAAAGFGGDVGAAESESPLSEAQEMELAAELLGATNEQELDQFLGDVLQAAGGAVSRFASSDTGQALGGILKSAVKEALPTVGRAVGDWVAPGGGDVGAQLASQAGQLLGLELEGLSAEDREFEVSRNLVRFAASAAQQASTAPRDADPSAVARQAVTTAARIYAPGLLRRLPGRSGAVWPRAGRWVRHGQTIVLYGC